METPSLYALFEKFPLVSTDTRAIVPGSLYFALRGEQFDGNAFAEDALAKGAAYAIIDNPSVQKDNFQKDGRFIVVEDVLQALQELARHHRQRLDIPVFGLTGSNGKTTTKELLRSVLSTGFEVLATKGNLNNHIGVPLTLLQIHSGVEIAIVEMGANHPGEIAFLCKLAAPTHGLITNVGKAHLEGFGSFEGVKKTKGELYDYLARHQGQLFIQGDNPVLREMAMQRFGNRKGVIEAVDRGPGNEAVNHEPMNETAGHKAAKASEAVTYGSDTANHIHGKVIAANPFLEITWQQREVDGGGAAGGPAGSPAGDSVGDSVRSQAGGPTADSAWDSIGDPTSGPVASIGSHTVQTRLAGAYNLENVLAAVAVGKHFGLSDEQINQGIQDYTPSNNRSQIIDTGKGNRIIGDYYNANASSMAAALESFRELTDPRPKVLILGDMFELGESAPEEHRQVIRLALEAGPARVLFIGKNFFQQRGLGSEGAGMSGLQPEGTQKSGAGESGVQESRLFSDSPNEDLPASASFFPTLEEARAALLKNPVTDSLILVKGSRGIALEKLVDLF